MTSPVELQPEPAFPIEEYRSRLDRLHTTIDAAGLDALLVHTPENVCYLSGWHTPGYYYPQLLVVKPGEDPVLVLRSMEAMGVTVRSWLGPERVIGFADDADPMLALREALERLGLSHARVGIDRHGWFLPVALLDRLRDHCCDVTVADGSWLVERLRKVKSGAEIEKIEAASRLAEIGVQAAIDHFEPGMTEAALSAWIHKATVEAGCEYAGLPIFVMSGHRMLAPHSIASKDKRIAAGENVLLELAGTVDRYAAALFRTFVAGPPSERNHRNMAVADEMLEAAIAALRPGVTLQAVNRAVSDTAARNDVRVRKRCGYSMGLNFAPDWGEGFFLELADGDDTVIEPGMVFHLPQVVRITGEPLVAVSETVLVTADGCRPLTQFRRGLIEL